MKRNSIPFAIALIAVIAFAGNASADPIWGEVNSVAAEGQVVMLYLDVNPSDYVTEVVTNTSSYDDYYYSSIAKLLDRNSFSSGDTYNATIEMRCSGVERDIDGISGSPYTNTLRNTIPSTAHFQAVYDGSGDFPPLMDVEPCPTETRPDLVVSNVYPQYVFADLTNVFSVNVTNQGNASTAVDCTVNLTITGMSPPLSGTVPSGLAPGSSTVVEVGNWKPTVVENIAMAATVDTGAVITEWDEGNNSLVVTRNTTGDCSVDDMLPDTCYGYRGQHPMTNSVGTGKVIYSVGDYKYKNNTVNFDIGVSGDENQVDGSTADIPDGATVKNTTLYVYFTWRNINWTGTPNTDPRPDYEISIDGGSQLTTNEYYTDMKGWAGSNSQYGTLVYDVTANVTGNGTYQAVRSNYVYGKGCVSGMALMIIYEDDSCTYAIAHGYDRLATYYKTQYKVLPEDATTTATLTDVNPDLIASANLFTVTVDAVAPGSESEQFNTRAWDVGAWDCVPHAIPCGWNYPLGINRGSVDKSDITASGADEVVKFQERTNNGFAPVFALLQTEAPATTVEMDDHEMLPSPSGTLTAPIWIRNVDDYGAATITLYYNKSVVHVTNVADGPFSTVLSHNINNTGGTVRISAQNTVGTGGNVEFARITFEAVGSNGDTTPLNLSVQKLVDTGYGDLGWQIDNGSITLVENLPPVISNEDADPDKIIQTIPSGRARNVSRNTTTLSVTVADTGSDVKNVTIDLSTIGGNADTPMDNGGSGTTYSVDTTATDGVNLVHNLVVTARDNNDNTATSTIPLEVFRRGDVVRDNDVNMGDALYIARSSVGLELPANNWLLVGDVVGAGGNDLGDDSVDMGDALFISRYTVGLEDEEP